MYNLAILLKASDMVLSFQVFQIDIEILKKSTRKN